MQKRHYPAFIIPAILIGIGVMYLVIKEDFSTFWAAVIWFIATFIVGGVIMAIIEKIENKNNLAFADSLGDKAKQELDTLKKCTSKEQLFSNGALLSFDSFLVITKHGGLLGSQFIQPDYLKPEVTSEEYNSHVDISVNGNIKHLPTNRKLLKILIHGKEFTEVCISKDLLPVCGMPQAKTSLFSVTEMKDYYKITGPFNNATDTTEKNAIRAYRDYIQNALSAAFSRK